MVPDRISGSAITEFFGHGFEHTAWRFETRRAYKVASETEALQKFLRGEPAARDSDDPWLRTIREQTRQGKRVERVRLIDDPPTDYQRFLLADVQDNIDAGEDIRYLPRADAVAHGLPMRDFWLFDSRLIGVFAYDGDRSLGMELVDDPAEVLACCQIRDAAWHYAIPYEEFARVASAE